MIDHKNQLYLLQNLTVVIININNNVQFMIRIIYI